MKLKDLDANGYTLYVEEPALTLYRLDTTDQEDIDLCELSFVDSYDDPKTDSKTIFMLEGPHKNQKEFDSKEKLLAYLETI